MRCTHPLQLCFASCPKLDFIASRPAASGAPPGRLLTLIGYAVTHLTTPPERAWLASVSAGARKHAEQAEALGSRRMLWEAVTNARLWLIMCVGIMKNAALNG